MKNNLTIIKLFLCLFLLGLLMTGCVEKNRFAGSGAIRYQKVQIPIYEISDYENLLFSENKEVKYNAICNLIEHAWDYAPVLGKEKSKISTPKEKLPTKEEIQNAEKVLDAIFTELKSKNENIKTASLIFITEFSLNYSNKEELFKQVEQVKAESLRTQYEKIRALTILSNSETKIDKRVVEKYLDSKSWLITSMTYLFLGKISSENIHKRLIEKYKNTNQEYNKLLIIHAFSQAFGPEVFHLIKNEILLSESKRIRLKIISILNKSNDKTLVAKWIVRDHKTIDKEIIQAIFNEYYSELASTTGTIFFNELLHSNQRELIDMIDRKKFFGGIYDAGKKQPEQNELVKLGIKVKNINSLNQAWLDYKEYMGTEELKEEEKQKREEGFEKTILPKYILMLENFLEESKKLFTDAGMDKDEVGASIESIREFLEILSKDTSK